MDCLLSNMRSMGRAGRVHGLEVAFYISLTGFAVFKRHDPMAATQAGASRLAAASKPASTLRRCNRLKAVSESRSFQFTRASPRSFTLRSPPISFTQPIRVSMSLRISRFAA